MVGEGSHAFLIDENHIRLAHGADPTLAFKSVVPMSAALQSKLILENRLPVAAASDLSTNLPGLEEAISRSDTRPVFTAETRVGSQSNIKNASLEQGAIASLGMRPWKVVFVINRATFLAPIEAQTRVTIILALVIASLAALGGLWVAQILTVPISQLTEVARQIASGVLTARAPSESANELGTLSAAFNTMTSQLQLTLEGLEERVAERTHQLTHRANQLQAAAEVGSAIASIRTLDELLPKITHLISQRFGYYHAGIFLIDPTGEYAVLRAANSEGGKRMLARNHQLKVNEVGIVGYVTGKKEPRIAMDVGQDAVFFNNPDLPETRSEMALPLVVGDRVLGALDVQSAEPDAFTQEDIATLQLLADQVAVAIDNARLFSENQAVLEAVHRAYGEQSREAWSNLLQFNPELGTVANKYDILYTPGQGWSSEMVQAAQAGDTVNTSNGTVAIPIKERDHILGILRLRKPNSESWTHDELALAETLAQQLYLALENARLFQETQRRAVRERLASEITAKMRLSNDPQVILQTAVQELRQALKIQLDQARVQPKLQPAEIPSDNGGNAS
jgi:GAF domain-containing protein/HAMP domain-containing protein